MHKEATMPQEIRSDQKLNLEGLLCPIPVVKVSQAIKSLPVGGVLEATASDPGVLADIPAWAKSTGNEVLSMQREGKVITFFVKKLK
jgi:tRNA 2-thiouridine synthesizing protein A